MYFMRMRKPKHPTRRPKARAADILATRPEPRVPLQWRNSYRRLVALRNYLLGRRGGLAKDAIEERPTFSMHMADAGTDEFDRDFALSIMSSEQDALYEIDEALNRIQNGAYGICELTGKRIEGERLQAIPWARFSAEAEKQLEREGGVARARLGRREEVRKGGPPQHEEAEETEGDGDAG